MTTQREEEGYIRVLSPEKNHRIVLSETWRSPV